MGDSAITNQPLQGIRVVDLVDGTGDLCGRLLADLGAEVIRVEPPGGATARRQPPLLDDASVWFAYRNANKRSIVLDLDDSADRERLHELLDRADVWIDSARPGTLDDIGLGPATMLERHPHLVAMSMTDFGQTGPYVDYAATDGIIAALGGMVFKAGTADREPLLPPGTLSYDAGSVTGAFAVLAALWQRRETGAGQHIDFSFVEAVAQLADWSMSNASASRHAGSPGQEMRAGAGPVYPMFKCKEGYVRLVVLSPRSWAAMLDWLGNPEYLQDPELATFMGRFGIADAVLNPLYEELFSTMTAIEVATEAQERGIVCTPVIQAEDVVASEHFVTRNTFTPIEVAPGTEVPLPDGLVEIDRVRQGLRSPAPTVGADTDAVFGNLATEPLRPRPASIPEPSAPLAGLRVMDFGHGGVGVECGRMMAEYGAEVIKVESVAYVDFIRVVLGGNFSPSFVSSSRSKLGFGANAKHDAGRAVLMELAKVSDVVIENNSTGTMDSLGVSYDDFAAVNPKIVMASSQLLGSRGAWSHWKGYGPNTQPVGGLISLWDYPEDGLPAGSMSIFPDHLAGRVCAVASMAALLGRERHGEGAHIEVAQVETVTAVIGDLLGTASMQPGLVKAQGSRNDRGAPWGVFRCGEGEDWVVITVATDEQWRALAAVIGDESLVADERYAEGSGRHDHADELEALVASYTAGRTVAEVQAELQAVGVPAAAMLTGGGQLDDPHLQARGYVVEIEQPELGPIALEGAAFAAARMVGPYIAPAPFMGEHTVQICRDLLGMATEQIEALVAAGALEAHDG